MITFNKKKMVSRLWIIVLAFITSCSGEPVIQPTDIELVSTVNHPVAAKQSKLMKEIKGKWRQINLDCDNEGKGCITLEREIVWVFKQNDVTWGRFTHPYKICNDTLYIAGIPHVIASNSGDTILIQSIPSNDFMHLIKGG